MDVKSEYWTMKLCLEEMAWLELLSKLHQDKAKHGQASRSFERRELLNNIESTVEEIHKIQKRSG